MHTKFIAVTAFALGLTGCATDPVSNLEATLVPTERVLNTRFMSQAQNTGEVTVKRDKGFSGSACSTRIFLDSEPMADIRTAEKIVLYLPQGDYILGAQPNGMCGGGLTEVKATVKSGSTSSYRFGTSGNGSPSIYPTAR